MVTLQGNRNKFMKALSLTQTGSHCNETAPEKSSIGAVMRIEDGHTFGYLCLTSRLMWLKRLLSER